MTRVSYVVFGKNMIIGVSIATFACNHSVRSLVMTKWCNSFVINSTVFSLIFRTIILSWLIDKKTSLARVLWCSIVFSCWIWYLFMIWLFMVYLFINVIFIHEPNCKFVCKINRVCETKNPYSASVKKRNQMFKGNLLT